MKYTMRRTAGTRWDRMVAMRSLQLMVINGVIRRAEVFPHRNLDKYVDLDADPEAALSSLSAVTLDEQSWFTRVSCRQAGSPFTHARNAT
ncbi:MAG TPA: hypothetical protein VK901_05705 [Nitrospiraceae bacterium]|nr:hypothetical protein [Nitrospiraceae bacterium]